MTVNGEDLSARFDEVVTSEADLRAVLGTPGVRAASKVIPIVDALAARFIAASPFVLISTANADGEMDISPKGDPAGFVKVLDEKTIAIPDRLGNRRLDTFRNLVVNPAIGLIFLIPGVADTLRVSGNAIIVRDRALRETMAIDGKLPDHAIVVAVERVLSHCPKCMIRSHLWQPEGWPDPADVPTLAEMLVAHAALGETVADVQTVIDDDRVERLY
jgi:PPOX class probable FMN-dependent enzyme